VNQPPSEDGRGNQKQSEPLIAAEDALLRGAARGLGLLLSVRFDAARNHAWCGKGHALV
jgi:hypothetical protein